MCRRTPPPRSCTTIRITGSLDLPEQPGGDRESEWHDRAEADMAGDVAVIVGISFQYQLHCAGDQLVRSVTEADRTFVVDERVAGETVLPAKGGGTQAEIVFLAVTDGETFGIERADRVQGVAADIHAEADGGRDVRPSDRR